MAVKNMCDTKLQLAFAFAQRLRRCHRLGGVGTAAEAAAEAEAEAEEMKEMKEMEEEVRVIHDQVVRASLDCDTLLGSLILDMYANRLGAMDDAHCFFCSVLLPSHAVDAYSWHHLIAGYAHHGMPHLALHTFQQMQHQGVLLNRFIAATVISACASTVPRGVHQDLVSHGEHLHASLVGSSAHFQDIAVGNAIVTMYGRCNRLDRAQRMFDTMSERNTFSWTAIIAVHAQNGQAKRALHLFQQMHKEGLMPNHATFASILCACAALALGKYLHSRISSMGLEDNVMVANSLIGMYGKCGSMADACASFDRVESRRSTSWNALMSAFVENMQFSHVIQLFQEMLQEAMLPDRVTYINAFSACAHRATMCEVRRLHSRVILIIHQLDIAMQNALLNAYAKCSMSLEQTCVVFLDISQPDQVSWTALISSATQHGKMHLALCLFDVMHTRGVMANEVTLLSVLYGCSHVGMMNECIQCFLFMKSMAVLPLVDHYNCILDLLAKVGHLNDAKRFVSSMPLQPGLASWMTLLAACKNQFDCDCKLGEDAASHVFELQSQNFASLVLLSQIYDAAARHEMVPEMM